MPDRAPAVGQVVVVTGAPATGKTTLVRALAAAHPHGIHLEGDAFHRFVAHPIKPTLPASHAQNTTIVRATARAARAFAEGEFAVFVEGIFGPWFLPHFAAELLGSAFPLHYAVLRAPLDETLRRAAGRPEAILPEMVRAMHPKFASLGRLEPHAIETAGLAPEAVRAEVESRLARGALRLDVEAVAGGG